MNLLLDTHVLIWRDEGRRLSAAARRAIADADDVYVSAASVWEVAIKTALDRLLVAQAEEEGLVLVSRDPAFRPYELKLVEA